MAPKSFANDDAGGGMTVADAVITSLKVAVLTGVFYVGGYFVSAVLYEAGIRGLLRFFVYNVPVFPNSRLYDLNLWMIEDMARTVLYLCAIFIPIALYRKIKK